MRICKQITGTIALLTAIAGCDSTVGLDPTPPSFTKLLVPGACKATENLQMVDLSVLMLNGPDPILPNTRILRETKPVGETITRDAFTFTPVAGVNDTGETNAFARAEMSGRTAGVDLRADDVYFEYTGGEERKNDKRLVVILMDHSGSLKGEDPYVATRPIDVQQATDRNDQRISFFQQLVRSFPDDWFVSLVSFNESFPNFDPTFASPTRNHQVIQDGFQILGRDETGLTPLADTLDQTITRIIDNDVASDLNPVVILFTDGVEEGDNSAKSIEEVTSRYAGHPKGKIPVIVLQLQPPPNSRFPRGRDASLVDLACRTGGEHIFIENANELTGSQELPTMVRTRIVGTWKVPTQTTLARQEHAPDNYFVSTELTVTLGTVVGKKVSRPFRIAQPETVEGDDTRLWFQKK